MTHVHLLRELAARQDDVVAAWQLLDAGLSRGMIEHRASARGWRLVHPGVYALSYAPLTHRQRWFAAVLTTRDSVLSHASAGACLGFRPFPRPFEVVTRPGDGGRRQCGGLLVCHSSTLDGNVTWLQGLPVTTAERTLIDLAAHLPADETARAAREALRLGVTSIEQMKAALDQHRGRRGTRFLRELSQRYATLPYSRTRSGAEARALEVLHDGGAVAPLVNFRIGGEEADLVWIAEKRIIEIDGPQYHRFPEEDERKARAWRAAGFTVERLGSDAVFERPGALLRLARGG